MGLIKRYPQRILMLVVMFLALKIAACGTLLYPERHGQASGRIDPAIAILDGVGIILFVIPGLVAFAVDFATGAIYLPSSKNKRGSSEKNQMLVVRVNPDELTNQRIEAILNRYTGHTVRLDQEKLRAYQLHDPESIPVDRIYGAY
jgi:hypothetical protein